MDDIVARYTLKFQDLASKGLLRAAGAAKAFGLAGTAAIAGIGALTASVIALGKKSFDLAGDWAEYYDSLDETAQAAGVSAGYLRNLTMALSDMGVDMAVANKGVIKFNQNLGTFRSTGVPKALSKISSGFGFLSDKSISTEQALQKTLETIAALPDAAQRASALGQVFGKAGPLMGAAVADLAALNAGMKIYNDILGEVSDQQLKDASDYSSAMLQAGAAWKAMQLAIGGAAAPIFIPMIKNFVAFLVANKDSIMAGFADAFSKLGEAMAGIDWGATLTALAKLIGYIPVMVGAFTWLVDNIAYVGAALATLKVVGWLNAAGVLVPLMAKLGTAFKIVATGAGYLAPLVLQLGKYLVGGLGGALARLGPLLMRIPFLFGPIGIAIGVVIAAGVLLYKNWDKVKATATALWGAVTNAWDGIDGATGGFLSKMVAAASGIINFVFAPIKAGIALLSGDFAGALAIMKGAWGAAWSAMGSILSGIWSGIKNVVATGVNFLIDKINGLIQKWNAFAPSFMGVGAMPRMQSANNGAVASAANRQQVAVAVTVKGEVKGATMQAPSVRTAQAPRGRGNNHPAGGRK